MRSDNQGIVLIGLDLVVIGKGEGGVDVTRGPSIVLK